MTPLFALLFAAFSSAQPAGPQVPPPTAGQASVGDDPACREDAKKLCSKLKPGEDLGACMIANRAKVSKACLAAHPGWGAEPKPPVKGPGTRGGGKIGDCASDAERLCSEDENLPGKRAPCLRRHYSELSPGCADSHPDWRPNRDAMEMRKIPWKDLASDWRVACPDPFDVPCREHYGSELAWWTCVERSWARLPDPCRAFARSHNSWLRLCPGEFDEYCPGVEPEKSTDCLKNHRKDLSKACRAVVDQALAAGKATKKAKPASPKRAAPRP